LAQILEGKLVRDQILAGLRSRIAKLRRAPGLAVVLVGHDPASEIYVRNKIQACGQLGIVSDKIQPPESISTDELVGVVQQLNRRSDIDAILVQMPLPKHVDARRVLDSVAPEKDADGFHPTNAGLLMSNRPAPRACTPAGIIVMLHHYKIPIAGKRAVVVGRSDIVGKPMALMLLHENATVTICHSRTPNLAEECRRAEILVAALGRPAFVGAEYIGPGATVIDVGINRIFDRAEAERLGRLADFEKNGSALVGDVHPLEAPRVAGAYTPVPGGVGPLTIAMLMSNTVSLAEAALR
jgi:methylenetetrahydrofolate dehydrogenase (NADP+)/methenyltetrahydrofolate cyclohydrolase